MVSAADQNRRDLRDFSAFGNDPWPVTAELIEMAQSEWTYWRGIARPSLLKEKFPESGTQRDLRPIRRS